ncbi:hypothetical protein MMC14_001222 [Varicellaria rhodocarpa]|nr:hypothetical protein [Varicellaria rhodocarpa]
MRGSGLSTSPPILPLYTSQSSTTLHPRPSNLSASVPTITTNPDATLLALNRQITHLQQTLQHLLDAQSTGLLAGLGKGEDVSISLASRRSSKSGSDHTERPGSKSRSPQRVSKISPPRHVSLHGARAGITKTLQELSTLSTQKTSLFESYLSSQTSFLKSLHSITKKRQGIATSINSINNDPHFGNSPIFALIAAETALDKEISESEEKVRILKAKRVAVKQEREQRENKLGAKLSSWQATADDLEKNVRDMILRSPPSGLEGTGSRDKGVWALPQDRRTVEIVIEDTEEQKKALEKQIKEVEKEREACVSGGEIWTSVVKAVENVESGLREEMGKLGVAAAKSRQEGGMRKILALLDDAIAQVEIKADIAEDRDWSLLICCIGAELEALKEGREMLDRTLDLSETDLLGDNGVSVSGSSYGAAMEKHIGMSTREVKGTGSVSSDAGVSRERQSYVERSEEEDDEPPGPELLISHQDED